MSEHKQTSEEQAGTKPKKIKLKGERPPGVIGEMHPERALEMMRRWREEGSLEEEERVWEQLDKMLPK